MTISPPIPIAVTVATTAAEETKRKYEEEEILTSYKDPQMIENFEFKILRTNDNTFEDPFKLKQVLREEAGNGWQLLEKFDDSRIRLYRKRSTTETSAEGIQPYRTHVGISDTMVLLKFILYTSLGIAIGIGTVVFLFNYVL